MMKKNIKNENGAISLFVLLSMMFFLFFMLGAFTLVNRRNAAQVEALKQTQKIYESGPSAGDKYDAIFASSSTSSVVPITNIEQLINVEKTFRNNTTIKYLIDGKVYTYTKGATYVLQDDIILDLEDTVDGKNNLGKVLVQDTETEEYKNTIYDYVLYNSKYKVNLNGHSIYYKKDDGSLWKLVCYQNIGNSSNHNLFSSDSANANYYGKSYNEMTFSILDEGISPYSHLWSSIDDKNQNFEFMLMYNTDSGKFDVKDTETDGVIEYGMYNRWRQTNNPVKENETETEEGTEVAAGYTHNFTGGTAKLAGYTATASDYASSEAYGYWGGLTSSSSSDKNCYLDGSIGKEDTSYYPVGISNEDFLTENGIVVAKYIEDEIETEKVATESLLFVRYK